ncbi:hypothetical protein E4T52_03723 [Aureobasidium sp. EXF-3400]|nr:hypothetical protein E4T52_03723 [Aureobasidium sp. EXF-3400]
MELPDQMLLLEPLHCTAEEIMQQGARNPTAVQNYLSCLERGWLGQALIERYTYTQSLSTPAGMIQTNGIKDGRFAEWLKPISDEIKDDLLDLLKGGYTEDLVVERDIYAKAMELYVDDPGRELLGELVEMIDRGLGEIPKIYVMFKNTHGEEVAPVMEAESCGVEDAITRLSEKVLEDSVEGMDIKKAGRDFHVTYQVDDGESASALVEDIKGWR